MITLLSCNSIELGSIFFRHYSKQHAIQWLIIISKSEIQKFKEKKDTTFIFKKQVFRSFV